LILEDGTILKGSGFGYPCEVTGEVVFNTGMVGYPEALTDPSYSGQILIQTYPLIGSYGVPSYDITDNFGIPLHFESNKIHVKGYAVSELQTKPSHWTNDKTLNSWLDKQKIPCIEGIDTRELAKKLRTKGTMLGILKVDNKIDVEKLKRKLKTVGKTNQKDLVKEVTIKNPIRYTSENSPNVVLIDCGMKFGILRNLLKRDVNMVRVPYDYSAKRILKLNPSGVVISNGPGNPKECKKTIKTVEKLIETDLPIMGICLGNLILSLAAGADSYRLKFGHHGQNYPAINSETKRCHITEQNHEFAIEPKTLKSTDFNVWFRNANDKTIEGIKHKQKSLFGVQFRPEDSLECGFIYDNFIMEANKCQS